jgi:hypothetical protein
MPPLPSAFTGQDFWKEVPKLRSPPADLYVVGRGRYSSFPLEFEAITRLAYPSIEEGVPEGWLNDRSIDAYMALVERELALRHDTSIRCYYLHQTIAIGRLRNGCAMERLPRHPFHISTVNPYEFKWLLFPVCVHESHFIMIVFNSASSTLTVMDSFYSDGSRPASEHFVAKIRLALFYECDCALVNRAGYRQYLHWQIRKQQPGFTEERITVEWPEDTIPQQRNGCDCGVFSLMFGLYRALGLPFDFTAMNMEYYRRKVAWDLLSWRVNLVVDHDANGSLTVFCAPRA